MRAPATAYISSSAIRRNVEAIRRRIPPAAAVCVAVKADAYGHGIEQVLPALRAAGIERLAVANLAEALDLRRRGWHGPILSFGPLLAADHLYEQAAQTVAAAITCTITSADEARVLAKAAHRQQRLAHIEIQVDTGMGRSGVQCHEAVDTITEIAAVEGIRINGVYMHFATSDEPDLTFARTQLARFRDLIDHIVERRLPVRTFHAANSAAVFRLPDSHLDLVRPGLSIYGYWGGPESERPNDLHPAMRITSRLTEIRRLAAGSSVGYGCTWTAQRDSLIGTVSIGYADGYRRLFGNHAIVTLSKRDGTRPVAVPVVGRVSMDQINVDLTDVQSVEIGNDVIVIDDNPSAPNSVESLARLAGTIPYEITTLIGPRVRRVAVP